jgi:hypothetical protein
MILRRISTHSTSQRSLTRALLPAAVLSCVPCCQLEAVPMGKRVKQLRQHSNPDVQRQAGRVLQKMRDDVKQACSRAAKAKPIVAQLMRRPQTSATLKG